MFPPRSVPACVPSEPDGLGLTLRRSGPQARLNARGVRPRSRMCHTDLVYEITEEEAEAGGSVDRVAVPAGRHR
jgi:hypothetical protein